MATDKTVLKGGEYLVKEVPITNTFIPEDFNEEQKMVGGMIDDFIKAEINPVRDKIEKQENDIAANILKIAGELGLLGTHMPEEYGGMLMDTHSNTLIGEKMGTTGSFAVSFAAHTGIGMLPILYFGTEDQKNKYLPSLISGEKLSAYCLTEPGSGSDALSAKTRADLSEDGKYYLITGQKMWITNAGFADLFIVFAKIDGDKFTAFIVERDSQGLTFGEEEAKLGIKGSSTRQIFFDKVKVPVDNVLGTIGKGHHIAFNVLNIGRFKLGVMSAGGSKGSIDKAIKYANEREQFGVPISSFGAIKYKIAEQSIRTFALESAIYRVSYLLQNKKEEFLSKGMTYSDAILKSAEEYAIECSIIKVAGSETVDYVVDETLQIHGGVGYSEELEVSRDYRDARINRIFEGSNEINRLLMIDMLLKRGMKGKIDIVGPAWEVQKELSSMPSFDIPEGEFGKEEKAIKDYKKIALMVAGGAAKMQMDGELNLKHEQMLLSNISDILSDIFIAESLLMRVKLLKEKEIKHKYDIYMSVLRVFIHDTGFRINKNATDALSSFAEGDLLKTFLMGLKRFLKYPPINVKVCRTQIANTLIKENKYNL